MPKVDLHPLGEIYRAHVIKMLKKQELIDKIFIEMLMSRQHVSGFNVHNPVRIKPDDDLEVVSFSFDIYTTSNPTYFSPKLGKNGFYQVIMS